MVEMAARRTPTVPNTAWLKTLPPAVRFAFYGGAAARAAALLVWGTEFSEEACRANTHAARATLWLGPDEYLLLDFAAGAATASGDAASRLAGAVATSGDTASRLAGAAAASGDTASQYEHAATASGDIASRLEAAMSATPHALVDIGHRQFALEVSGPHATTILSGACPLDLDLFEFPVGMCTRTVFAKADIVLWRTRDEAFHLEVWRSFAGYVGGLLHEIGSEFYPD